MLKQMISRLHVFYLQWQKVLLLRSRFSLKMRYKRHMSVLNNMWKIFPKSLKRKSTYTQECSPIALLSWMFSCNIFPEPLFLRTPLEGCLCNFQTKVVSRRFHVVNNTIWKNIKMDEIISVQIERNEASKIIYPLRWPIKGLISEILETVGHITRNVSRYAFFLIGENGECVDGSVLSTRYHLLPIPSGKLEIPLMLTFRSLKCNTHQKMIQ